MTLEVALRHAFESLTLDVGFIIPPGITALFGPSGAGKTTVIKSICGTFNPASGRISFDGQMLLDTSRRLSLPPHKRGVGMIFQEPRLFPHLTVRQNLAYGWRRRKDRPPAEYSAMTELLELQSLLSRRTAMLSGGERQRVALGRAFLAGPKLLLLDEPLTGLDRPRKEEILTYFERLRDKSRIPMIYVTHSIDEVIRLADEVIVLSAGQVIAQGSVTDVFARSDLAALVGEQTGAVITARVESHAPADHLTALEFESQRLLVPLMSASTGQRVRLRILARDITLALDQPARISANNVLPVTIVTIRPRTGANAEIELRCGSARLLAQITRASVSRLGLGQGTAAFAIIKSVTIDPRPV